MKFLTEEDAKGMACVVRTRGPCIGFDCMAWRENVVKRIQVPSGTDIERNYPYALGWRIERSVDPDGASPLLEMIQQRGYFCGLAGVPK